jgi:hypothetical protein
VVIIFLGKGETVAKHLEPHQSLRSYYEDFSCECLLGGGGAVKRGDETMTSSGHTREQGVAGDELEKAKRREISSCFPSQRSFF